MIKAPFNFVPLNKKVFFPEWAEYISHDIPFEDGVSGEIDIKITAHSPIYVRNGGGGDEFNRINDTCFIPATSIKGAVRNVLEILSFGKMTQVENSSFAKKKTNKTIYDGIGEELKNVSKKKDVRLDLCEAIFGHTYEPSLKGRVQFGHLIGSANIVEAPLKALALSTPHPSYYPLYLGLNSNGEIQDWNNVTKIAGRKRYPVRNNIFENIATNEMQVNIVPLKEGAEFKGKIRYHNLLPIELGALLSSLTFHNQGECFHNLGYAKPLGYGKSKVEVCLNGHLKGKEGEYIKIFEKKMESFLGQGKWLNSIQLRELFVMAKGIPKGRENSFIYMNFSLKSQESEFKIAKDNYMNQGVHLGLFSDIIAGNVRNGKVPSKNTASRSNHIKPITDQEKEYGWEIDVEEPEFHAYIHNNDKIRICDPDRYSGNRQIECKYEIDHFSKVKDVKPGDVVKMNIIELDDDENIVLINVRKVLPPKKR